MTNVGPFAVPGYHVGDARELLRQLPDESVNCVVTSPPYWSLRDYGNPPTVWGGESGCGHSWATAGRIHKGGPHGDGVLKDGGRGVIAAQAATKNIECGDFCESCGAWRGQLGLEPTPDLFVDHMVEVFREVRRVLRADGTAWVNLGDSYCGNPPGNARPDHSGNAHTGTRGEQGASKASHVRHRRMFDGIKTKDLVGVPWMVAFALRAEGWYLRMDNVWSKPNPMPEAVTDRPTKSHEYLFLLTKSAEYFYDADAIKEPVSGTAHARGNGINPKAAGKKEGSGDRRKDGFNERWRVKQNASFSGAVNELVEKRNKRSVWTIATEPTPDAHFATFPRKLVEPCILAGCPGGGARA